MLEKFPDSSEAQLAGREVARILAIDGGDSKTDIVLADRNGRVLVAKRIKLSSHLGLDHEGGAQALDKAIASALGAAGSRLDGKPIAEIGVYCLAGADLPVDERRIHRVLSRLGWSKKIVVRNDTLAVLRAGTDRGWGIGIVCGSGMNAAGVAPDGRSVRFPAFGELSGDLAAGGGWIGMMALAYAVRSEDGRGRSTTLERRVPAFFKLPTPTAVTQAMYLGRLSPHRLHELPPVVFDAARRRDAVARQILNRVADEVVAFASSAIKRLGLGRSDVEVVLGGGVFRAQDAGFHRRISLGIRKVAPKASIRRLEAPPVVGAALAGLDAIGASPKAAESVRAAVTYARLSRAR